MSVTIQDIADAAGTSIATVSRTLNNPAAAKTRVQKRVLRISRELGYQKRPRRAGRSRSMAGQILMLESAMSKENVSRAASPMFTRIREMIEPEGYSLVISSVAGTAEIPPALRYPEQLSGILFHGPLSESFFRRYLGHLPVVGLQYYDVRFECNWVMVDNEAGMYEAVAYLHRMGHRRIGFVANEIERMHSAQRYAGYRQAMQTLGLEIDERWVVTWQRPMVDGIPPHQPELPDFTEQLEPMLCRGDLPPTAIVTPGTQQALAVITVMDKFGFSVPGDVSIMAMASRLHTDTMQRAGWPRLSGIDDRAGVIAASGARLLLDQIEDRAGPQAVVRVRPELVEGDTVRSIEH